jgi:hypothetical protein
MDDERLKNPPGPGVPDYFDELLERIRDIRASEQRMYLRVREIFALAADYLPNEAETHRVFQVIQNKLHFAVTGRTAPELIAERANAAEPNMGLTSWKSGAVRKGDVTVAKNYLLGDEIEELNRIVVMFLDFAEDQARRRQQIFLRDWRPASTSSFASTIAMCYRMAEASRATKRTKKRSVSTTILRSVAVRIERCSRNPKSCARSSQSANRRSNSRHRAYATYRASLATTRNRCAASCARCTASFARTM